MGYGLGNYLFPFLDASILKMLGADTGSSPANEANSVGRIPGHTGEKVIEMILGDSNH